MDNNEVGLELRSLGNLIKRYFAFHSHENGVDKVTGNNGWIIGFLVNNINRDVYQKDIEEYFTITRSTASKVLSLMEQKGLIERQKVSQDARLKKIVLTEKAWEIRGIMEKVRDNMEQTLISGFSDDEINTLLSYIKRMKDNIATTENKN